MDENVTYGWAVKHLEWDLAPPLFGLFQSADEAMTDLAEKSGFSKNELTRNGWQPHRVKITWAEDES